jgi:hypothetical protein
MFNASYKKGYKKCYKKVYTKKNVKLIKIRINNLNNLKMAKKLIVKLF